jgi:flagellar biosynthesis GTPase FlhF
MEEEPSFDNDTSASSPGGGGGGFLTADSSTILMQADLSRVVMTPLRAAVHHPTASKHSIAKEPVLSFTGSRESANDDETSRREGGREGEQEEKEEIARQRKAEIEELLQEEREKIRLELQAESAAKLKQIQDRASTEQATLSSKLAIQQHALAQKQIQITNLNKILSKEASENLKLAQLELEISRQTISSNHLRRLKSELNDLQVDFGRKEKVVILDKSMHVWKGYEKELEVERAQIALELDMLDQLRALIGHIALNVQDLE